MKKLFYFYLVTLAFVICDCLNAQAPNWIWAKKEGGPGNFVEANFGISNDGSGNIYTTGYFNTPTLTVGGTTLIGVGNDDVIVTKYDSNGNVLWSKSTGGPNVDHAEDISTDAVGNTYVTGFFDGPTITFGSFTLTNIGLRDLFVVKYDSFGNIIWAKSAGGTGNDYGHSITLDASGNVFVTGNFDSSTLAFGSTTVSNTSVGFTDIFLAKYDSNGNILWANGTGGTWGEESNGVTTDGSGNAYITGAFSSPSLFFGTNFLSCTGASDIFVAKYDTNGNVIWANKGGGSSSESGYKLITDMTNNVFVVGYFNSCCLLFGSSTIYNGSSGSQSDMFLVKYDSIGNFLWANRAGGLAGDNGSDISIDQLGNVSVVGSFNSDTLFIGNDSLINKGPQDIFIFKYDTNGNLIWIKNTGGIYNEVGNSISTDVNGNTYITGFFGSPTIPFGSTTLTLSGSYNGDIYVAKLGTVTTNIESNNSNEGISIYPNPMISQTILHSDKLLNNASITIYNCIGQTIKEIKNVKGQNVILEREYLPSGMYFVSLKDSGKIIVKKKIIITD